MKDYIIGDDKAAIMKYKMYHKFWLFPMLWLILAIELRFVPIILFEMGWIDFIFPNVQIVGHVLLYATPLVLFYSYHKYDVPWGVLSLGETNLSFKVRKMGIKDTTEKRNLSYEDVISVRYNDESSILSIKVIDRVLDFIIGRDAFLDIEKELNSKIDEFSSSIL